MLSLLVCAYSQYAVADTEIVNQESLEEYREVLLEPLALWVARGLLIFPVVEQVEFPLPMANLDSRAIQYDDPQFNSTSNSERRAFEPSAVLSRVIGSSVSPKAVLFESQLSASRPLSVLREFDMHWYSSQGITRSASGFFFAQKYFEIAENEEQQAKSESTSASEDSDNQGGSEVVATTSQPLARAEVVRLIEPAAVAGFSQLLWRDLEGDEQFFAFSPVIAKLRQVPAPIRSDPILRGQLSQQDFLVFGEHLDSLRVEYKGESRMLGFFAAQNPLLIDASGSGISKVLQIDGTHQMLDGRRSMVRFNGEQRQFAQFVPWMPLSTVATERSVYIFQINTADPFTSFGKELVIIDQRTLLPLYKLVYSNWGSLERVVIGIWAVAHEKENPRAVPVLASVLGVAASGTQATSITARSFRFAWGIEDDEAFPQQRFLLPASLSEPVTTLAPESDDAPMPISDASPTAVGGQALETLQGAGERSDSAPEDAAAETQNEQRQETRPEISSPPSLQLP